MPDPRPTLDAPDDDPYLWLEDVDGEPALAWVATQNARTLQRLAHPTLDTDRDAYRAVLDRPDNIPLVTRRAGLLYNFWRDATHPRGLWRRTTAASYRTPTPAWETLLDLDALAAAEAADWVWHGADTLPPNHDRAILRLSRGGSDAVTLREYDLPTRSFPPGGFTLPEAKSSTTWLDRDTLLLTTALAGVTTSGYASTIRLWTRGADPLTAPTLAEIPPDHMAAAAGYDRVRDEVYFIDQIGFFDLTIALGDRTGPRQPLDLPTDTVTTWHENWLVLRRRTPWTVGGHTHAPDTVLAIPFDAFLAGSRTFEILFEPTPRRALRDTSWAGDTLVISILDNLHPLHLIAAPGAPWSITPLEGLPTVGTVSVWPLDIEDTESDGTLLAIAQTPIDPPHSPCSNSLAPPPSSSAPPRASTPAPPPSPSTKPSPPAANASPTSRSAPPASPATPRST